MILLNLCRQQRQHRQQHRHHVITQKFLEKREETTKTTYEFLGNNIVPADNLIKYMVSSDSDISRLTEENKKYSKEKRKSIYEKFEESQQKWNASRMTTVLLLSRYYNDSNEVKNAWSKIDQAITEYFKCAEYCSSHQTECKKCETNKTELNNSISVLEQVLGEASRNSANIK